MWCMNICLLFLLINRSLSLQSEYGFAHRVNDPSEISLVLNGGANGIELDICSGYSIWSGRDWYVSHNDANHCNCAWCVTLKDWLLDLNNYLNNNPSFKNQLAMLWIDIKEPSAETLDQVPDIIHSSGLYYKIKILYDLTAFNEDSKNGYNKIVNKLNKNEGISFCAGKSCGGNLETVNEIYNFYKNSGFKRGTFNTGDSANTDEDFIVYSSSELFTNPADPYRFKMILTWTDSLKSSISEHTNPYLYFTNGQIYGNFYAEWDADDDNKYIEMFTESVNKYPNKERIATSDDDPFHVLQTVQSAKYINSKNQIITTKTNQNRFDYIIFVLSLVIITLIIFICFCVHKIAKHQQMEVKVDHAVEV